LLICLYLLMKIYAGKYRGNYSRNKKNFKKTKKYDDV
jgi:hypothetical protein